MFLQPNPAFAELEQLNDLVESLREDACQIFNLPTAKASSSPSTAQVIPDDPAATHNDKKARLIELARRTAVSTAQLAELVESNIRVPMSEGFQSQRDLLLSCTVEARQAFHDLIRATKNALLNPFDYYTSQCLQTSYKEVCATLRNLSASADALGKMLSRVATSSSDGRGRDTGGERWPPAKSQRSSTYSPSSSSSSQQPIKQQERRGGGGEGGDERTAMQREMSLHMVEAAKQAANELKSFLSFTSSTTSSKSNKVERSEFNAQAKAFAEAVVLLVLTAKQLCGSLADGAEEFSFAVEERQIKEAAQQVITCATGMLHDAENQVLQRQLEKSRAAMAAQIKSAVLAVQDFLSRNLASLPPPLPPRDYSAGGGGLPRSPPIVPSSSTPTPIPPVARLATPSSAPVSAASSPSSSTASISTACSGGDSPTLSRSSTSPAPFRRNTSNSHNHRLDRGPWPISPKGSQWPTAPSSAFPSSSMSSSSPSSSETPPLEYQSPTSSPLSSPALSLRHSRERIGTVSPASSSAARLRQQQLPSDLHDGSSSSPSLSQQSSGSAETAGGTGQRVRSLSSPDKQQPQQYNTISGRAFQQAAGSQKLTSLFADDPRGAQQQGRMVPPLSLGGGGSGIGGYGGGGSGIGGMSSPTVDARLHKHSLRDIGPVLIPAAKETIIVISSYARNEHKDERKTGGPQQRGTRRRTTFTTTATVIPSSSTNGGSTITPPAQQRTLQQQEEGNTKKVEVLLETVRTMQHYLRNVLTAANKELCSNLKPAERAVYQNAFNMVEQIPLRGHCNDLLVEAAIGHHAQQVLDRLAHQMHDECSAFRLLVVQLLSILPVAEGGSSSSSSSSSYSSSSSSSSLSLSSLSSSTLLLMTLQLSTIVKAISELLIEMLNTAETHRYLVMHPTTTTTALMAEEEAEASGGVDLSGSLFERDVNIWEDNINGELPEIGKTRAASLNTLVKLLTSPEKYDATFMKTFIVTYHSFTTPKELFEKLVQRYNVPPHLNVSEEEKKLVQLRVVVVIKYWVEHQFHDFDSKLMDKLYAFLGGTLKKRPGQEQMADMLCSELEKQFTERKRQRAMLSSPSTDLTIPKPPKGGWCTHIELFTQYEPEEIARQLTMIDYRLYKNIQPLELLQQSWNKPRLRYRATNVRGLIDRLNRTSFWVASMILWPEKRKQRTSVLSKFIQVAECLWKQRNFNTLMGIIAGINMSAVARLRHTKGQLKSKRKEVFAKVESLMNPERSYFNYREELHRSPTPLMPFLGVYLTDLTFIEDGNPDTLDGLINFNKRVLVNRVIQEIQVYQQTPYTFDVLEPLHSFLYQLPACGDKELYTLSVQREPKGSDFSQVG
ncbi:Ras guanine nucleotide exchange factor domain-containing protein [Balamuthia mandrillaris]